MYIYFDYHCHWFVHHAANLVQMEGDKLSLSEHMKTGHWTLVNSPGERILRGIGI